MIVAWGSQRAPTSALQARTQLGVRFPWGAAEAEPAERSTAAAPG
jgi:hypothetical protein